MSRHLERGRLLLDLGRAREAASEFAREVACPGDDQALALALLALTELDQDSFETAAAHLARARGLDPRHPAVRCAGAVCAARQGDLKQMRIDLLALRMDAPSDPARIGLAALLHMEIGDVEAALKLATEGLEIDPNEEDCLHVAAAACANLGRHAHEDAFAERLIRLNPLQAHAHVFLARRALREDDLDSAATHAHEALRLEPGSANAHAVLLRVRAMRHPVFRLIQGQLGRRRIPFWLRIVACFVPTFAVEALYLALDLGKVPPPLWRAANPGVLLVVWLACFLGWIFWYACASASREPGARLALKAVGGDLLAAGASASILLMLAGTYVATGVGVVGVAFVVIFLSFTLLLVSSKKPAALRPWIWLVCGGVLLLSVALQRESNQGADWAANALFGLNFLLAIAFLALAMLAARAEPAAAPPLPPSRPAHEPPPLPR